jgi:hypothetical protein
LRRADVAFACSLNNPIAWRLRQLGTPALRRVVRSFALTIPDGAPGLPKALSVGQIAASPRTVHHMAASILKALSDGGGAETAAPVPTLLSHVDRTESSVEPGPAAPREASLPPNPVHPEGRATLMALLSAPLCNRHGTLRRISDWCADRRDDVSLHFAKTGTRGTGALERAANDTVDLWVAGGIRFEAGPAYSYVILIGTGNPSRPWARDLYAGAVTEPLQRALLEDLAVMAAKKQSAANDLNRIATVREASER